VAHARSDATYGAPRILEGLREAGYRVRQKRVARLMRTDGLRGVSKRRGPMRPRKNIPEATRVPDLVRRDFCATAPHQRWVADITYLPTVAGFLYLAVVLDVFSRRIVGWSMRDTLHTTVVLDALDMAATQRRANQVIHHSDASARLVLFRYIEGWYNPHRRHSALGQRSPLAFKQLHAVPSLAA